MKKEKKTIKEEIEKYFKGAVIHNENCCIFTGEEGYCDCEWGEQNVSEIVLEIVKDILQRFIEETKLREISHDWTPEGKTDTFKGGYNQALDDINQKQTKWLKENL